MSTKYIYKNKEYVQKYDNKKYGGNFGEYLKNQEITTFMSMIDSDCERILDVGSGTGKLSIYMNNGSYQIVSLDNSYEMVEVAKSNAIRSGIVYLPVVCDANFICFNDRVFNYVLASRVLMHLSDWEIGLAEICRVSKKTIIFDFPSALSSSLIDSVFKFVKKLFINDTDCYKTFLISRIIKELKNNHFRPVEIKKEFFLPLIIHRILDSPEFSEKIEKFFKKIGLTDILGSPAIIKAVRDDLEG